MSFHWVSVIKLADKNRSNTLLRRSAQAIAKLRHTCYSTWRRNLSHNFLLCQISAVASEELALPPSFVLLNSCSVCGHQLEDLTHLLLDFPASEPLRLAIFGTTSPIFDHWSKPWGVDRLLGLCGVLQRPHLSVGVG